ncbi:MAG: homocysteine S-methyltransferase, partial [Chloroflexi bacterium]|nr:homocysteine S-methyltransferase [Chloroflexota bacterium]
MHNPIRPFLNYQNVFILDGGLATELETRGHNLDDPLWSAKILLEQPEAIRQLHSDYLWAGADCVISASYQATLPALQAHGFSESEAADLIRLSVQLAQEARDQFWAIKANRRWRLRPLVAASVGPYGAYLANGAEYTGDYDLDEAGLLAWHRPRWQILASSGADLLACE